VCLGRERVSQHYLGLVVHGFFFLMLNIIIPQGFLTSLAILLIRLFEETMVVKPIRDGSGRSTIGGILSCEARSELLAVEMGAAMEMEAASFFW
jgi:hypothetical protein